MSFKIELMRNMSETNKVGKDITVILETNGILKDETSILDPVFRITCSHADAVRINYIHVPLFTRYYFVKDIVSLRQGVYEFSCHVDVLESWKQKILNQAAIVRRQEQQWNMYLNDGQFKTLQKPNVYTEVFPSGFDSQTPCVAMAVAGGRGSNS